MTPSLLSRITGPDDVKALTSAEIPLLAGEIRETIIDVVGKNGGHLASNLGVVELTIALHRVFSTPEDSFVWDVGHQCYTHKLLTGRFDHFKTIRKRDGLSGFPKHVESLHDSFDTGHSSTSISAALGIRMSRHIQNIPGKVIAVIGDGALTGGMALEALSHAGEAGRDLVVVLNDNKMSIGKNTGALSEYLSRLTMGAHYQRFRSRVDRAIRLIPVIGAPLTRMVHRLKRGVKGVLFKDNLFVDLGFEYVGPLNGHNVEELEKVFRDVRVLNRPVVVHVQTCKGKGYSLAEDDPSSFHGIGPFSIRDGKVEKSNTTTFTQAFSKALMECAEDNERIVAITAAMTSGTGLGAFQHEHPERFFDVGIAEQHAVTFAGGLAAGGLHPVVAIYSTFMQRAVDQVIHDVALQNLPVVFALDRSGAVPDDGETHQGIFDISLFRSVPGLSILAPATAAEMKLMLQWAFAQNSPVMLRYPKGPCPARQKAFSQPVEPGRGVFVQYDGKDSLIVCTGGMYGEVHEAANILGRTGNPVDILNIRFVKPFDESWFIDAVRDYRNIVFVEDGVITGSLSRDLASLVQTHLPHTKTDVLAFQEIFYPQGTRAEILTAAGLSPAHIADCVTALRQNAHSDYRL